MRALVLLALVAVAAPARADTCRPSVTLDGDAALVAQLGRELEGRGIAITGPCPAHAVFVEWRGDTLVVSIEASSRSVRELQTAAAVIESFVRADVASPLLEIRPVAAPARAPVSAEPTLLRAPSPPTGWHLFGGLEESLANDHTRWSGLSLGACYMVGPLCAAVRVRGNVVENERGVWGTTRRKSAELLVGFDVPFRAGRFLLTPGVASGFGGVTTQDDAPPSRSNNFRAQAHLTFSIPLSTSLALDLMLSGTLAQLVQREPGYMTTIEEPFGFVRFGVGMRYGDR